MSSYRQMTKDPRSGEFVMADWLDDYFGRRRYGVRFPDGITLEADKYSRWETRYEFGDINDQHR